MVKAAPPLRGGLNEVVEPRHLYCFPMEGLQKPRLDRRVHMYMYIHTFFLLFFFNFFFPIFLFHLTFLI